MSLFPFFLIQVLQDTYEILKNRGFEFEERGYVNVKGKGKLLTYILVTQSSYDYTRPQRPQKDKEKQIKEENKDKANNETDDTNLHVVNEK